MVVDGTRNWRWRWCHGVYWSAQKLLLLSKTKTCADILVPTQIPHHVCSILTQKSHKHIHRYIDWIRNINEKKREAEVASNISIKRGRGRGWYNINNSRINNDTKIITDDGNPRIKKICIVFLLKTYILSHTGNYSFLFLLLALFYNHKNSCWK